MTTTDRHPLKTDNDRPTDVSSTRGEGLVEKPLFAAVDRLPLKTSQLFGDSREIQIDHGGRRYCLRITRKNGLILNAIG